MSTQSNPVHFQAWVVLGVVIGLGIYNQFTAYALQMSIIGLLVATVIIGGLVVYLVDKRVE